jgi:hypothetical protein
MPLSVMAQWYGDGLSAGTAYYGVINSSYPMQDWNTTNYPGRVIYVGRSNTGQNDLEVGTGGTLNIGQGMTIKFCTISSDLRITGTGVLNASGSSSNYITFTKDAQATWGHISFEASTGNSMINFCIIEYGYKNGSTTEGYGGGVHANTNNLSVTNSIFRNNYAQWGGGIFVNASNYPSISNCNFYNNQALHAGGGIYCWNSSSSVITNCLFDSNQCLEPSISYYTGGGLAAQSGTSIKVINCTFVNNTSNRPEGQGILIYSSPNARVINSIFWGSSDKQVYCYGTAASIMINCAYRGITYSSGAPVNPIVLNATNTAPDGPNFTATDGSDWSIRFISPCRDKGVDSYPGITIPSTDYLGNSRIYTTDIGAYEVQYSRWRTQPFGLTSNWFDPLNWENNYEPGHTGTTGDIAIPLLSSSTYAPVIGGMVYINPGNTMVLEPGAMATLSSLTNNGTLLLESDASNISSLITDVYASNDATVQIYLTGGGTKTTYKWHYISSPITSLPVSTFSPAYTLDLAQWVESRPTSSLREGWVAYDGYVYSTGISNGPTFSSLNIGQGYDYWRSADKNYTFSGHLNTGDITVSLGFSGDATLNGFNLLGNPFSSGLNWDDMINSTYFPYPPNTSKSLYFTRDNVQCSYINGVGIPADVTGIIPPMQGFFNKTYSSGNSITFPATSRIHDLIHPRYKGLQIIPLIRLALMDDTLSDETVIRFNNNASPGLDYDYDAIKFSLDPGATSIYTISQGTKFAINGQPFPTSSVDFPVVLNLTTDTALSLKVTQLQGLDNYDVQLIDNSSGQVTNLKTTPLVPFTSLKGSVSGRFIIRITSVITEIKDPVSTGQVFNIYSAEGIINILSLSDDWEGKIGSVRVFDLTGKTISYLTDKEFNKNLLLQIQAPSVKGIYMVELKAGVLRYVGRVVIR